ncbi:MAG: T9SS type A sorting domain-containing protein, partial [bacterium]
FNPSTIISFQLPVNSHVTLKVFDVTGREVATLVDGNLAAGNHAVTFAPRETTTGLYFYKITAGKFSQTRKAVLMK